MANFDELNRQTREHNKYVRDHTGSANKANNPVSTYWLNYYNNQTYKQNNGAYSSKYF